MTTASLPVQVLLVQVPVRVLPVSLQALSVKVFLSSVPVPEPSVPMSILQELISIAARVPINQSCYTAVTVSIDFCPKGRTDTLQLTYIPQLLAVYIQYKYIYYKMYIPQPCAQKAHRHPLTDIYPPIVGSIYPTQMYL